MRTSRLMDSDNWTRLSWQRQEWAALEQQCRKDGRLTHVPGRSLNNLHCSLDGRGIQVWHLNLGNFLSTHASGASALCLPFQDRAVEQGFGLCSALRQRPYLELCLGDGGRLRSGGHAVALGNAWSSREMSGQPSSMVLGKGQNGEGAEVTRLQDSSNECMTK